MPSCSSLFLCAQYDVHPQESGDLVPGFILPISLSSPADRSTAALPTSPLINGQNSALLFLNTGPPWPTTLRSLRHLSAVILHLGVPGSHFCLSVANFTGEPLPRLLGQSGRSCNAKSYGALGQPRIRNGIHGFPPQRQDELMHWMRPFRPIIGAEPPGFFLHYAQTLELGCYRLHSTLV